MLVHKRRGRRRRAATLVETAMVFLPLVVLMFGIFEYGRLLMAWNLLNNAAREGCRYALVNNTSATISTDVQSIVTNYMAGQTSAFSNFTVTVSGTHNGTATAVNNLVAGDMISVNVSGQYQFLNIIPGISLPASLSLNSSCIMLCEGVT
jgi:Flp pilus assembly protein TadG